MMTKIVLLFILGVQTILSQKQADCLDSNGNMITNARDAEECADLRIVAPRNTPTLTDPVGCTGFKSCYESTIITDNTIRCSGGNACEVAKFVQASANITCSGILACTKIKPIRSNDADLSCLGDKSCYSADISAGNGYVICNGPNACMKSDITAKRVICNGYKGCQQTNHLAVVEVAFCDGQAGCAYATLATTSSIDCRGKMSCEQSALEADTVNAYGYLSLNLADHITAKTVNVFGYKAMVSGVLDSAGLTEMTVNLFGYAASGVATRSQIESQFICRENAQCELNCKGNGCQFLVYACINGNIGGRCTITPSACGDPANVGGVVDFVNCPQEIANNMPNRLAADKMDVARFADELDDEFDGSYDGFEADIANAEDCNDYQECKDENLPIPKTNPLDEYVFCLGDQSCLRGNIQFDDDIQCYGYESCINAVQITTDGTADRGNGVGVGTGRGFVKCSSTRSCYNAGKIDATDTVFCRGVRSCAQVRGDGITSRKLHVKCDGVAACEESIIYAEKKVDCWNQRSCMNAQVMRSQMISCNGPYACSYATLNADSKVDCDGFRSCVNAEIRTKSFKAYGTEDTSGADIYAKKVKGYGYRSLAGATIYSQLGESVLVVESAGYNSGEGALVKCMNDKCKIYCEFSGCRGMQIIVSNGAKAKVYPTLCEGNSDPSATVDGTFCPVTQTVTTVSQMDNYDVNIETYYNKNPMHIEHEFNEEYQYSVIHTPATPTYQNTLLNDKNIFYGFVILCGAVVAAYVVSHYYCPGSKYYYIDGYQPIQTTNL